MKYRTIRSCWAVLTALFVFACTATTHSVAWAASGSATTTSIATMSSPIPSSTLSGSAVTFTWTAGSGVAAYKLILGTTAGASNVYNSYTITTTSAKVTGIPTTNGTIYATLYSEIGSAWSSNAYTYTTGTQATKAVLTTPTPSSTLTSSSATFVWSAGTGVSAYKLLLGTTVGASNVYNSYTTTATSAKVTGIPTTSGTLYATLYSEIGSVWSSNAYTYTTGTTTPKSGPACNIYYTITPQNASNFGGAITINNTGTTDLANWTLTWTWANGQGFSKYWNAAVTQTGANVSVANLSYNGSISAGGSYTGFGFNGTWNGVTNAVPTSFSLNGTVCSITVPPSFKLSSSASSLSILQGKSASSTITITGSGGFSGGVALTASSTNGLPTGVTAVFSPSTATTTSTLTLTASTSAAAGTYPIIVTGTSGSATATANLSLTVNTAGSFTLTPSPATLKILPTTSVSDTISITDVSPFSGSVLLSASGLPSGVTATFNTNSATTTGTLTLAASLSAKAGNYTITVIGVSGTLTETTTIAVSVAASPLEISWLSPNTGVEGTSMTIMPAGIGATVGSTQGTGGVYFGKTPATIKYWDVDAVTVIVPTLAVGDSEVTVVNASGYVSNALPYTVVSTTPSPNVFTGNSTWFSSLGQPYGGCGVPQPNLDTQNFVALNVQTDAGNYSTYFPRPITGSNLSEMGLFDNGHNCGRYVHVTIVDFCTGINNGAPDYPFCQGANGWQPDAYNGAELDMVVADSCQDGNAWCRDDPYHLDLAQPSLNLFEIDGKPVGDMYPDHWQNRQISWYFEKAPNYTGDINIGFVTAASVYWPAISVTHLLNGIHGVQYYSNGAWTDAVMDGDMGEDYVLAPITKLGTSYKIRVTDVDDKMINNGRTYSFSLPSACQPDGCTDSYNAVTYTTSTN